MNRIIVSLAAAACVVGSSTPATAAGRPADVCTPTRPTDPSSTDDNPGAGGRLGLNEDYHEDGHPYFGEIYSDYQKASAQDDIAGNETLLAHTVGNDCNNFDEGD
jgi:hypothetical protein